MLIIYYCLTHEINTLKTPITTETLAASDAAEYPALCKMQGQEKKTKLEKRFNQTEIIFNKVSTFTQRVQLY